MKLEDFKIGMKVKSTENLHPMYTVTEITDSGVTVEVGRHKFNDRNPRIFYEVKEE